MGRLQCAMAVQQSCHVSVALQRSVAPFLRPFCQLPTKSAPAAHRCAAVQEVHGSGDIPPDFADPSHPDWVEAARWLARQRDLYGRQKLLLVRVRLLKELLGECTYCWDQLRHAGRTLGMTRWVWTADAR